ncbi:hypothetical protein OG292_02535 [Streptomyces sp. NBC_01511]|uniref:hypothetical protein n=1 Tax=Streptomyces sp. NBC_01511 TaxID=2903889 RepID=UPI003870DDDB
MAANDQMAEIQRLLQGTKVHSVGRAADLGVIEFAGLRDDVINIHIQCPFRILQEGKVILGSRDMRYPQQGAGSESFEQFGTVYDSRAATLNGIFERIRPAVAEVSFGDAGHLAVGWEPRFRIEVFPDCSGSMEAWRVFLRGGPHYGFPQGAI